MEDDVKKRQKRSKKIAASDLRVTKKALFSEFVEVIEGQQGHVQS